MRRLAFLTVLVLVSACGSGNGDASGIPEGIDLPRVGSLGRAPTGAGTIVLNVTAEGRMTIDGNGPLSLMGLREEFQKRTRDLKWREPDRSSMKNLLVNADADLPWTVAQWIMQTACEPTVGIYRIFFGASARDGSGTGAIGWTLPKDGPHRWGHPIDDPPRLALKVFGHDGRASDPDAFIEALRAAAGDRPVKDVYLEIKTPRKPNTCVSSGFVLEVVDVALRAGVERITFEGAPLSKEFEPGDVEGLLDHVARLRGRLANPLLRIGKQDLIVRSPGVAVPVSKGRLAVLYGSGIESEEPQPVDEIEEDEEALDEVDEEVVLPEPVLKDEEIEDFVETDCDLPYEESLGADGLSDAPFTGPSGPALPLRGRKSQDGVDAALDWLAAHQSPNGGWEARGFGRWCEGKEVEENDRPDGLGNAYHDVGVTGLALCAFLGAGYTNRGSHAYAKTVAKGLRYLKNVQDAEGCFGSRKHGRWIYDHAAAALAMVKVYGLTKSPIWKSSAQKALDFIAEARNPTGGWRYGVKPGETDASVTVWMALALYSAKLINDDAIARGSAAPLLCDDSTLWRAVAVGSALTDPETGRTGYLLPGGPPDRAPDVIEAFPPDRSEAPTAGSALLRLLTGERPQESPVLARSVALLEELPPLWDAEAGTIDHVYWFFGTPAAFMAGGSTWKAWSDGILQAIRDTQRLDTDPCLYKGSWEPVGPWGWEGGRVASTALLCMCLEVYYRYDKALGTR